jgi:lipopolysaccharide transport system permease protein
MMATSAQLPITIHTAEVRLGNPRELVLGLATDIARSRHIAWEMMKRDLKSQYRTSILGVLIPVLPALTTAAWAILFRDAHLINVGAVNMPYPFFVLCGMMLWAAFLESMDAPISGVLTEQALLSKADVPAEAVTIARIGLVFFNFGVKSLIIIAAAIFYRVHVPWTIVLAPIGLVLMVALGAAIGLILAPINLLYSDVARALPVVTTFWFFTTPIIFTTPTHGLAGVIMRDLNPVTPLLTTTRELAFGSGLSMPAGLEITAALTIVLLAVGLIFHRIAMPIVIDRANV